MSLPDLAGTRWSRWHTTGVVAVAGLLTVPLATLPRHIPLSYNEGWNGYFAARAMNPALGPLYPSAGGLISNNYPPLSFYIVGAAGRIAGDPIIAGRIVALAALLASAVLVAVIVRQLGGRASAGATAALVVLGYVGVLTPAYVATDDPQWLAHAVMIGGVVLLLARRESMTAVATAAALVAVALFIKHNLLALPAATTLWLIAVDRRAALVWGLAGAASAAILAAVSYDHFGGALVDSVIHHERVFDTARLWPALGAAALLGPLLLVALLLIGRGDTARSSVALVLLFAGLALPFGVFQRGGEGVADNAYFEALIALCLTFGLVLSDKTIVGRIKRPILIVIVLAPLLVSLPRFIGTSATALATLDVRTAAWERLERRIAATPGPVACELLAACFWGGKDFAWDFFNEGQRLRRGAAVAPLAARIAAHEFGAIVLTRPPGFAASSGERLPAPLPALIDAAYVPVLAAPDETVLLVPRSNSAP